MGRQATQSAPSAPDIHESGASSADDFSDTTRPCDDAMLAALLAQTDGSPAPNEPTRVLQKVASIPIGGRTPASVDEARGDDTEIIASDEASTTYWYGTPPPSLVNPLLAAECESSARKPQHSARGPLQLTVCTGLWAGLLLALLILPDVSEQIWHEMMALWSMLGR